MKYTNKYALVPVDSLHQQKQPQQTAVPESGLDKQMNEFFIELRKLLADNSKPPEEVSKVFNQLLQRYHMLAGDKGAHDLQQQLPTADEPLVQQKFELPDEYALQGVPKNKMNQAKILLQYIKNNPRVRWNNKGEILVDNQLINGSHVTDLLYDFSRDNKCGIAAIGHTALAGILKEANVPRRAVGNSQRWQLIQQGEYKEPDTPVKESVQSHKPSKVVVSPTVKRKRKDSQGPNKHRRLSDYEEW